MPVAPSVEYYDWMVVAAATAATAATEARVGECWLLQGGGRASALGKEAALLNLFDDKFSSGVVSPVSSFQHM